jgi:DNA-binding transcriptional MocR family regulator
MGMNEPLSAADPDIAATMRAMSRRRDLQTFLRYQPPEGMPRHRAVGAKWLARCGVSVPAERVVVCSGAQHALLVSISAVASPGDWIFVEALAYPGIQAIAKLLQLRLHAIPMDDEGLVPEGFASACRQRKAKALYCVPTLHNPTLTTLPAKRRRAIAKIAKDHGVAIIEDDVMRPLVDDPPPALAALEPTNSFFITTLSKAVTGGLRVAFVSCPEGMASILGEGIWATQYMVPPLMAEIAVSWIEDGTAERTIRSKRDAIRRRCGIAQEILVGLRMRSDPSSYHLWLELPEGWSSAQLTAEARRRGVIVTPAEAFQTGGTEVPRAVRVCLGAVDDEQTLRTGLGILADLAAQSPDPGRAIV